MKKVITALSALLVLSACNMMGERIDGSGNIKTENRNVGDVRKIRVMGDIDVFVTPGSPSVRVEGDDNILQYIETIDKGDWFEIKTRDHFNLHTSKTPVVYVTTNQITDVRVSGSGNVTGEEKFSSDDKTSFDISGSGNIKMEVNAPKVEASIAGSGNLHIAGETKDLDIQISGSGNYDGPDLKSENAHVSIAGSGDANLFAENNLKASIAGSGNVKYKGNPTVDSHVAGSGTVSRR